jgi:hypothetical protein
MACVGSKHCSKVPLPPEMSDAMRQVLYSAAIVFLWAIDNPSSYDLRHKASGYLKENLLQPQEQFNATIASSSTRLKVAALQSEIRLLRSMLGDTDAELYRYCHTYTPATEKERKRCARLDKEVQNLLKR